MWIVCPFFIRFFFLQVVAFMMDLMLQFMPKWISHIFWAYPLCTVIDCLLKLPALHTNEMICEAMCQRINCNWHELCEQNPDCCRK